MVLGVLAAMAVSFSGCDVIHSFNFGQATNTPEEDVVDEDMSEEGGEETALLDSEPQPLMKNYRPLAVTMPDGLKIEGTLYVPGLSPYTPPSEEDAASAEDEEEGATPKPVKPAKVQVPLIVLCHMLSGDRWEWKEFPRHLVNAGFAVLVFDMRGHGNSVYQGKTLKVWRQFDKNTWDKLPKDIGYVLAAIAKNPDLNMVNTKAIGLIGSSIGANVAVNYAGQSPKQVRAMVLLSPGLEYHGIETFAAMTEYENAVFFIASKEDAYAAESTEKLYKFALGKKKIQIYQDLGHGTDMLRADPDLGTSIRDWLREMLPPPTSLASDAPAMPDKAAGAETSVPVATDAKPAPKPTPDAKTVVPPTTPSRPDAKPSAVTTAKTTPAAKDSVKKPQTGSKPTPAVVKTPPKPAPAMDKVPVKDLVNFGTVPQAGTAEAAPNPAVIAPSPPPAAPPLAVPPPPVIPSTPVPVPSAQPVSPSVTPPVP